jgi:hypothetical protein
MKLKEPLKIKGRIHPTTKRNHAQDEQMHSPPETYGGLNK